MSIHRAFYSVPEKELVAVLQIDEKGEELTKERIDGEWQSLSPEGANDEFDYLLVDMIDDSKLDEFLEVFDEAEDEFRTLTREDVQSFMKQPQREDQ